ncbi:alpha/beta-hydrolase [Xylariaceae sp. FL0016]|nr:alpha/beta-hydrolase [Xylariaceae sp. FL0016]
MRVSAPATDTAAGARLPILLLNHGQGFSNYLSSLEGYVPTANFWAMHGFAVIQPTHLSSRSLSLEWPEGKELYWQSRATDMSFIVDNLSAVEEGVPFLKGRLDHDKVVVVGHSFGAFAASTLLGLTNTDPRDSSVFKGYDPRIKAGVVIGGTGNGGSDLSENGRKIVPFYGPDFSTMVSPALVVIGNEDVSPHLTTRGADWHGDPYSLAPGPKALLTIKGCHHGFGGLSGPDAAETRDESPERLAVVQRMVWAWLWSRVNGENRAWEAACKALEGVQGLGSVESKE